MGNDLNLDSFDTLKKWEMTWKNPNSFDTIQKMGIDLEKSRQFWNRPENKKWSWKIWSVVKLSR